MADGHLTGDELKRYLTLQMLPVEASGAYSHMLACSHCNAQYRQLVNTMFTDRKKERFKTERQRIKTQSETEQSPQ
jgi:hypothetical protein